MLEYKETQQLFSNDEFCLGSVTSKAIELRLYKTAVPSKINKIYIESGRIMIDKNNITYSYLGVTYYPDKNLINGEEN